MKAILLAAVALTCPLVIAAKRAPPIVTPPPIVRVQTPPPEEVYGVWHVTAWGKGAYGASTTNDADSVFGVVCTSGTCSPFFNAQIACDDGHKYPALINSSGGAALATGTCTKIEERYLIVLPDMQSVLDAMTIGGDFGIAFPMKSGQFAVSRFSLTGALKATARAEELSTPPELPQTKPKDDSRL